MPFKLIHGDITKLDVDAIVNAANNSLLGGSGVDGAIHRAAGPELLEECRTLGGCATGDAKITKGYNLPAKHVIHTVGPIWHGGNKNEEALLRSAYRRSLEVAVENDLTTIAFPMISAGAYGYPKQEAKQVAIDEITAFLMNNDPEGELTVYLVAFSDDMRELPANLQQDIDHYLEDAFARLRLWDSAQFDGEVRLKEIKHSYAGINETALSPEAPAKQKLSDRLEMLDESFSEMLLRKIDEKGMTDPECYKKANVSRKLFSKIRSDKHYRPSKQTAVAFAIALELSPEETDELLMKAGYALSRSNYFDVIVSFYIESGMYNIFRINQVLFKYDQQQLGSI